MPVLKGSGEWSYTDKVSRRIDAIVYCRRDFHFTVVFFAGFVATQRD